MFKKLNIIFLIVLLSACSTETTSEEHIEVVENTANHEGHNGHSSHDNGHSHSHEPVEVNKDLPIPTVSFEVIKDPKSGWNLFLNVENFKFNARAASTEHVDGEGHAHLYINDKKITRLYGPDFFIENLDEGENNIRVELSSTNHGPLTVEGKYIDASVIVEVTKSNK